MPEVRPEAVMLIAAIVSIIVQAIKGPVPEQGRVWVPPILLIVGAAGGAGVAFAYGSDPIAGLLEGFLGAATSLGFYETAKIVPGFNLVFNKKGWFAKKKPELEQKIRVRTR